MIKYASNAFLATKISFINEIANVCEEVGADVDVVAAGDGPRRPHRPALPAAGIGYGGSCFPKDVKALKQLAGNPGYHFQLLMSVIEVNDLQKRRVVGKLERHLGSLRGRASPCSGWPSRPTPTTCARPRASCWRSRCGPRGRPSSATTPSRWRTPPSMLGPRGQPGGSMREALTAPMRP